MVNSPTWASVDQQIGWMTPGNIDSGITRDGVAYPSIPLGTVAKFQDVGTTRLGTGSFIFLPGVTATVAGDVVNYRGPAGLDVPGDVNDGYSTIRWTGGANTAYPLAVATAATDLQSKWGWYQIQGGAICNVSGTVTAGNKAYFGQTATLQTNAAVAGKQVLNIYASTADGVPDTGKAIFEITGPLVQSAIT